MENSMKNLLPQEAVEKIKNQYPIGTRIEMIHMEEQLSPVESGMKGTVQIVDDVGTLHMKWDNGRTIGIIPNKDQFKVVEQSNELPQLDEQNKKMGGMNM